MVNYRLYQISLLSVLLLISHVSLSSPQLILFTDKDKSTLGRPIRAELYGVSLQEKITDIKLDQLNNDFGIVTDYVINKATDKRWPNKLIQILKFKLYPRKTGNISIPSLSTSKAQSQMKIISVTKGKTSSPTVKLSINNPYERQQISLIVTLKSHDSSSRLSIKDDFSSHHIQANPLQFKRIRKEDGSYELTIGWALTVLKSGKLKLELPSIEYSVSGVARKKFYLPVQVINIKTLPSYLPPTIPVGNVKIKSHISRSGILRANAIHYWNIELSGNHSNAFKLPAILRQIKSNNNITFLPVNSKRSKHATNILLTSSVNHSIPFKISGTGIFQLPKIQLQYFNPISNKIRLQSHHPESVFVLSYFIQSILIIFTLCILSYIVFKSYRWWQRLQYSKNKRNQAIRLLHGNVDIENIRQSIRLIAESECWPKNLSLNKWARLWMEKYYVDKEFENTINRLSSCIYNSKESSTPSNQATLLLDIINNRKKL